MDISSHNVINFLPPSTFSFEQVHRGILNLLKLTRITNNDRDIPP